MHLNSSSVNSRGAFAKFKKCAYGMPKLVVCASNYAPVSGMLAVDIVRCDPLLSESECVHRGESAVRPETVFKVFGLWYNTEL